MKFYIIKCYLLAWIGCMHLNVFAQLKPIEDFFSLNIKYQKSFINIYESNHRIYFEIPEGFLGKEISIVNRIVKGTSNAQNAMNGYSNQLIGSQVIKFGREGNRIILQNVRMNSVLRMHDSNHPMYTMARNNFGSSIQYSFEIKALSIDKKMIMVDMTDMILISNELMDFSAESKVSLGLLAFQSDKSRFISIYANSSHIEVFTSKTFGLASGRNATIEVCSSWTLLPEAPMRPRYADERIYFNGIDFFELDSSLNQESIKGRMIYRYRLEPKREDIEKYNKGQMVEPKKPIIFYIDSTIPSKWIPYFIQGVNDWQPAFEKAGFKNAIFGKKLSISQSDSSWSFGNSNMIVYIPSGGHANAYGGIAVSDPLSGEILRNTIYWYHNIVQIMCEKYIIQASPSDPNARRMYMDDELIGKIIRYIISHEVGHCLGLSDCYAPSSTVPVDNLRNKAWLKKHGHTPSVMDYARFNYVAQPEDNVGLEGIWPRVGEFDELCIEFAYKPILNKTPKEEKAILNEWIKKRVKDNLFRYAEHDQIDPTTLTEDLGDDAIKAGEYGLKNLQWVISQLPKWVNTKGENYSNLTRIYKAALQHYRNLIGFVITNIGGIYSNYRTTDQDGNVYEIVPREKQRSAVLFLKKYLFQTPVWLLNNTITSKIAKPVEDPIVTMQLNFMEALFAPDRLNRIIVGNTRDSNAYQLSEYFTDLYTTIWEDSKEPDIYLRYLQKAFMEKIIFLSDQSNLKFESKVSDITSTAYNILTRIWQNANTKINIPKDGATTSHFKYIENRINRIINPGN